jgi:hypothetical protein
MKGEQLNLSEIELPSAGEVKDEIRRIYENYSGEEAVDELARYVILAIEEALLVRMQSVRLERLPEETIQDFQHLEGLGPTNDEDS